MPCEEQKNNLPELLSDELGPVDRDALARHLVTCLDCAREFALLYLARTPEGVAESPVSPPVESHPDILTPEEAARYLRVATGDVLDSLHVLPHLKIGKQVRFRREGLARWAENHEQVEEPQAEVKSASPGSVSPDKAVGNSRTEPVRLSRTGRV